MSYIGRSPQIGAYHKLDSITTDGSASYTMQLDSANFVPESVNHLIVSVNGVIQAPTDSFTVSGSTITFASSLSASDTIDFIMALGNVLDIGVPSDSTVSLSKLTASGTKDATTFLRGDNTFASVGGGDNTPSFKATMSGNQTISTNTNTKIQLDTEDFDTNGAYDHTTNYRFTVPSGEGGKYYVTLFTITSAGTSNSEGHRVAPYVNGAVSNVGFLTRRFGDANTRSFGVSGILTLSESDYVEVYVFLEGATSVQASVSYGVSNFSMYKLIGA